MAVNPVGKGEPVKKSGLQSAGAQTLRHHVRISNKRKDIRAGIHARQYFGDTFAPANGYKPMMDYGNSHVVPRLPSPSES
jgi:hypothetical protein